VSLSLTRVLAFAAVVEAGTGLVAMIDPAIVVTFVLGVGIDGEGTRLGRCFGIALLALAMACWPGRQPAASGSPAVLAMLTYNAVIALYLAFLRTVELTGGLLVWPAVGLHAGVALAIGRARLISRGR